MPRQSSALVCERAALGGFPARSHTARATPALTCALIWFLTIHQELTTTAVALIQAPALGRGGALTYPRRPRPKGWCAGVELSAPRTAVGINEYLHALSHRDHGAVRRA